MHLFRSSWSRTYNFIKQAGTIILLGCVAIWFLANLGIENGSFGMVEDMENSILGFLGKAIAWIFIPCGFGDWQAAVATLAGFLGKENLVSTLGVLYANGGLWANLAAEYTAIAGMAFMLFNLLCAPCIAAMATIKKELRSTKWFVATIAYQCTFAYVVALCTFQIGSVAIGQVTFNLATAIALICIVTVIYLLFRQPKKS
ncbi:MAG: hypothetical protein MJ189_01665 [Coriobacteriales bacterium]|nr:hypothetical protein [Coriobacteriales bacterium]